MAGLVDERNPGTSGRASAGWRLGVSAPDAEQWLEALPAAVLGVDAGLRICFVNSLAVELLGRGLRGRGLEEAFGAGAPLAALAQRAHATGALVADADVAILGLDAGLGRASVNAAPIGDSGYVVLVLGPLMRARAAGAAARNAARVLAHEVRNPLAGIRAAAQLIARGDDNEATELATLICAEVDRIGRLTDKIDPLAAAPSSKPESFNVHEVLERVRALVGPTAPDIPIRERYDPSLPPVSGDFDQLIQAFLNIAKNAVEALAGRSDAEIAFVTGFRSGVHVRSAPEAAARAQLEVQIVDNGPGLHPDIVDRLFEPFATTKSAGMGLGLAVVASIVARHQGRVEVESRPGRTAFRILLPIDSEARE